MFLNIVYNNDNIMLKFFKSINDNTTERVIKNHYDKKTLNNITRARNKILDYCYNNDFTYFLTCTISTEFDRTDLNSFIRRLNQTILDLRKKYKSNLFYLIVPELHKDLKSWHIHGLIGGDIVEKEIYLNKYNYFSFKSFDKLGFNSLSKIRNKEACNIYITKYITKSICMSRKKGEHCFYVSKGLNVPFKIPSLYVPEDSIKKFDFDFSNDYVYLKKVFNHTYVTKLLQKLEKEQNINVFIDELSKVCKY